MARTTKNVEKKDVTTVETPVVDVDTTDAVVNTATKKNIGVSTPLIDSDEIKVTSLIPNVSYLDKNTGDYYEWNNVGDYHMMTFAALKTMYRNHRGYFTTLLLKMDDSRAIKHFGLTNILEKYEFLMNESNYTRDKISKICETIEGAQNTLKDIFIMKVCQLVSDGKVTDIQVIKSIEKKFGIDLVSSL